MMSNVVRYILYKELTHLQQEVLLEVKHRIGRRTFPEQTVKELIQLGLIAGDYSMLYVTDKGDDILGIEV
jgi:hypothetical protein